MAGCGAKWPFVKYRCQLSAKTRKSSLYSITSFSATGCRARAAIGPPVRHPSRRLRAIPKDNLLGQIDEGAQARGHVAASWIIEAISGIGGRPLAENFNQPA